MGAAVVGKVNAPLRFNSIFVPSTQGALEARVGIFCLPDTSGVMRGPPGLPLL